MIPSRRLVRLALAWALLGGLAAVSGIPAAWGRASLGLLLLLAVDGLRARRVPVPTLRRRLASIWSQGRVGEVVLELGNPSSREIRLLCHDQYPGTWEPVEGEPGPHRLAPRTVLATASRYRATRRGTARFRPCRLELVSPWGFWLVPRVAGGCDEVRVVPDVVPLLGHGLSGTNDSRPARSGALRTRRRGEGTEFHQLREYRQGDSLRHVDWKASARLGKPVSREYREERDQQLVFLLDCGRRMLARDGERSHFEHALEALLRVAWVAARQGDAVGFQAFAGAETWLEPAKGMAGFERLLTGVHDLHPGEEAPDYALAAQALARRLRRRSLVVLVTNLRDEDDDGLRAAVAVLSRRHLVVCASLREGVLDEMAQAPIVDFPAALDAAAARLLVQARARLRTRCGLPASGLLDLPARELPLRLVDRYLEIKAEGRL